MNKMLVVIFDNERAAGAGSHALRKLHERGAKLSQAWGLTKAALVV